MASMGLELVAKRLFLSTKNCNQKYRTEATPEVKVLVEYTGEELNLKTDDVFVINKLKQLSFDVGS